MIVQRLRALDGYPLLVGLLLVVKILAVRHLVIGHALGWGLLGDLVFLAAIWAFAASARGRRGRLLLALAATVTSAILLGIVLYASYFEQLPSAQMLLLAGQVRFTEDVLTLLTVRSALLLADLPFVLWAALRLPAGRALRARTLRIVGTLAVPLAMALTLVAGAASGVNSLSVSYRFGLLPFESASMFGDRRAPGTETVESEDDLQAQIDRVTRHEAGPRTKDAPRFGEFTGKSVIVIQMEALQAGLIGARIRGQAVVPNLEAFAARSHFFPNTYSQIGRGNTADAEFVANTSLLPPTGQPASVAYAQKAVPSLPRLLGRRGYTTVTFHTNTADFWNRFQLYPALGFGDYCDRAFFGDDDITGYGPSDRILYEKTLPPLVSFFKEKRPFYANIVTLSAHYPFRATEGLSPLKLPPDVAGTATGRYLEAQAYADQQLGSFISRLNAYGMLDDCVVAIYGDHFGLRWEDETEKDVAIRRELYAHSYNRADFYNVPLLVHLPGQERAVQHDTVLGQVDIMPTLADLLGVGLEDVPHFGRSAFVETPTVITRPGALPISVDDTLLYVQGVSGKEDRFYLSTTQEKLQITQPAPDAFEDAVRQLQLSDTYCSGLPKRAGTTERVGYIPKPGVDFR